MINVGDQVRTKTPAGLHLADQPCDGTYEQKVKSVGGIQRGVVLEVQDIIIDYDTWADSKDHGLGKVRHRNVLVKSGDIIGWAGDTALIKMRQKSKITLGYCKLCRAKEIELFGTVVMTNGPRHRQACKRAGCIHPVAYKIVEKKKGRFLTKEIVAVGKEK